uniref:Actin-related protein 2/3 complex subunit 1A n=1 Tax=Ditylenchus dipsaci TaxID=166011 RepID=A0A915EKQ8_9BILA
MGWIHDVAFSPSGCRLAWVAHDSTVTVVDKADQSSTEPIVCRSSCLPFVTLQWTTESNIIAAGHDCTPVLFSFENKALKMVSKLDVPPRTRMLKSIEDLHQNAISQIQSHTGKTENVTKFSTCGIDGLVALWDLQNRTAGR